jgi:hypothetical protein
MIGGGGAEGQSQCAGNSQDGNAAGESGCPLSSPQPSERAGRCRRDPEFFATLDGFTTGQTIRVQIIAASKTSEARSSEVVERVIG